VDTWLWDFGDRMTSVGNPVDHTFTQAGEVIVVVTARNRFGDTAASARLNVANAVVPLAVGDRVAANVDLAGNNSSIRRGDSGTLVCLEKTAGHDAFVNWDYPVEHGYAGFAPCAGTSHKLAEMASGNWNVPIATSKHPIGTKAGLNVRQVKLDCLGNEHRLRGGTANLARSVRFADIFFRGIPGGEVKRSSGNVLEAERAFKPDRALAAAVTP
jgi:PKD repeat protein